MATPPARLYGLDHLRTLAILLVWLFHYQLAFFAHPAWLETYAAFGWTGVDLFFVLSGFLIASQLFTALQQQGRVPLRRFFLRRVLRILPAFWVVVAIYYCVPAFREREHLPSLWRMLSFTQNIGLDLRQHGTFSHAWSLCVEEHFYLLLPVILMVLQAVRKWRHAAWLLPALWVACIVGRQLWWSLLYSPLAHLPEAPIYWYRYIYYPSWCRLDGLLAGVAIAALYVYKPAMWQCVARYGNVLLVAALAVLAVACYICVDQFAHAASVYGFAVVAVGYGLLVMAAISPSCILYRWRSRVTTTVATLSYGIYLLHKGVVHVMQQWCTGLAADGVPMLLLCMLVSVLLAWVLYRVVERPVQHLYRYFGSTL